MFTSVVAGLKNGPVKTFTDAFVNFFPRVIEAAKRGMSLQTLETNSWIEGEVDGRKIPLSFYDARDFAYMVGILAGRGELQNPLPNVDPSEVRLAFFTAYTAGGLRRASEEATTLATLT
jgi:hypothetical protein